MAGPFALTERAAGAAPSYPSLRQSWWPMLLLFLAANLYSIDKAIVGVLAEPIKADLGISDIQMGLLLGLAFTLLSGICGLWLGSLADRGIRRNILAGSIILWSLATAAGGLAPNFASFFVFRALVGLGEGAIAPAALSLLADMFPPARRGRAISGYMIGASVGTALSSIIPGWILSENLHLSIPGYGQVVPWRTTFLLCGMIGPVVGLLFFTIKEPVRHGLKAIETTPSHVKDKLAYLWRQRSVVAPLFGGFTLYYVAFIGVLSWTVPLLMRTFGVGLTSFAGLLGGVALVAGLSGYLFGGFIVDTVSHGNPGKRLRLMALLPLIALPCAFAGYAPSVLVAILALATISFATPILNVATNVTIQEIVSNDMRGFSFAFLGVVVAIPAGAGGPFAIAWVTQTLLGDPLRLGQAFLIVGLPCFLLAAACFLLAARAYARTTDDGELARVVRSSRT
ncbi:MFS transporter [Sphingomonas sp. 4RDLI-65]|uniref:MFS transporter n=1 Tax=Sphingomonas sp. 4RDLI-65 TaxID=3111641 RepID=UPI003C172CCA